MKTIPTQDSFLRSPHSHFTARHTKNKCHQQALPAPAAAAGAPDGWGGGTYCIEVVVSVHTSCSRIISVMGRGCTACCVHGAGGKAGVEPIPKQIDSGRRRPAVGRRARGGRSRWSRSTSPGAGRPGGCMGARAAAMWTRPGQRRRCTAARPVHEQARGEAGGGRRPGRRKYLCTRKY